MTVAYAPTIVRSAATTDSKTNSVFFRQRIHSTFDLGGQTNYLTIPLKFPLTEKAAVVSDGEWWAICSPW